MSYDYSLFIAPGPAAMSEWDATPPPPFGTFDDVRNRLAALDPQTWWKHFEGTWFGDSGRCQFQVTPDPDDQCRFLTVRRVSRDELRLLCRELGVVAVDNQTSELIRP